ncbi:hypothetical protein H2O64_02585 [Kordia sp. YSTF-M3]|uniref:Uncharacterized protein n=1 Tax=Kordia aestuariivivens TaxID=2759037 RepID=A0ABR7Q4Q3_9FLAO|nr:hypothetical protein [Kordia aestuariivivens]MBC8753541.1 hypothetical protein [Kordia aestuariivivens]
MKTQGKQETQKLRFVKFKICKLSNSIYGGDGKTTTSGKMACMTSGEPGCLCL